MKKKLLVTVCTTLLTFSMTTPVFAAGWQNNATGWWWQNNDGSWPSNSWQWLDGNNDGVAECYYFNGEGYMLANTTTPDGYTVNADGAWAEKGIVQTQRVKTAAETQNTASSAAQYNDNYSGVYTVPFYEMDGSVSSQTVTIAYNSSANTLTATFSRLGYTETYTFAGTDFRGFTYFELVSEYEKDAIFFSAPGVIEWPADGGTQSVSRN